MIEKLAAARRRSTLRASPGVARSSPRASSTARGRGTRRLSSRSTARHPREPDGERVLRLQEGGVHRRRRRPRRIFPGLPAPAPCSWTKSPTCRSRCRSSSFGRSRRKLWQSRGDLRDPVDVRIICATHQNLAACVESGKFRQDLYYRLAVIELKMPPLREWPRGHSGARRCDPAAASPGPTASAPCGSPKERCRLSRATIFRQYSRAGEHSGAGHGARRA